MAERPNRPAFTPEHREKLRQAKLGKKQSEQHRQNAHKHRAGKHLSEETKRKMSDSQKGRKITWDLKSTTPEANMKRSKSLTGRPKPVIMCPHCNKSGGASQMKQWHFDNCKEKK